jgi:hypothetical protein
VSQIEIGQSAGRNLTSLAAVAALARRRLDFFFLLFTFAFNAVPVVQRIEWRFPNSNGFPSCEGSVHSSTCQETRRNRRLSCPKNPSPRPRYRRCRYRRCEKRCRFSSALTMNLFPLSRWASAIQLVRPSESKTETQPQLPPALLRLSTMISQYLMIATAFPVLPRRQAVRSLGIHGRFESPAHSRASCSGESSRNRRRPHRVALSRYQLTPGARRQDCRRALLTA